jgi:hypothetical protein
LQDPADVSYGSEYCLVCCYSQLPLGITDADFRVTETRPEALNIVLVDEGLVAQAEDFIDGCEACCDSAELTFDYVFDALTGADPTNTEYLLSRPAKCPRCRRAVTEKTLVLTE